jgi:hypothetical protein
MVEQKEKIIKTNPIIFQRRLIVKVMGKREWIEKFCSYVSRLFPPERITFSEILNDRDRRGYEAFCFINIIMPKEDSTPENDTGGTE